jgi:hypothetical protein
LPTDFQIIEDADCTDVLGITKYEPAMPACLSGIAKGKFLLLFQKRMKREFRFAKSVG